MGLTKEMNAPVIPLMNRDSIVELVNRYNPDRKLPHLTIIDKHGSILEKNALDLLLTAKERDDDTGQTNLTEFFETINAKKNLLKMQRDLAEERKNAAEEGEDD